MNQITAQFTASARTVEMLGRQQIAGIPNAISELFKNAYDAYADRVVVEYYLPEHLLVLRDNGLGMTREDIEQKWLVLGTDSKVGNRKEDLSTIAEELGLEYRNTVGEKGIGRLAIGVIGPQVLLLSRAKRLRESPKTVAVFVNWSLFEIPGVSLNEIVVPLREFDHGLLPTKASVASMVDEVRQNLKRLRRKVDRATMKEIEGQLDGFAFDPATMQARFGASNFTGDGFGTQFYIHPVDSVLDEALDERERARTLGTRAARLKLRNMLVGFTNTMVREDVQPPIDTEFYYYPKMDVRQPIIGSEEFFTPEEFASADHHISGRFDERGQFTGTVSVYGSAVNNHVISWPEGRGGTADCGPFHLNLAYVQGQEFETRMYLEDWRNLNRKLDEMGGLYIYRNGIRILPYGDPDVDFLRFEERRSRRAATYFFSYRRMFGTIELSNDRRYKLQEKAGREGFMENRAFRQFRDILEHFFTQLAADVFREDSPRGTFQVEREELSRQAKAARLRDKEVAPLRSRFVREFRRIKSDIESGGLEGRVEEVIEKLRSNLSGAADFLDPKERQGAIVSATLTAVNEIENLRATYKTPEPEGFGANQSLRRELNQYDLLFVSKEDQVLRPASMRVEDMLRESGERSGLASGRQRLLRDRLHRLIESEVSALASETQNASDEVDRVAHMAKGSLSTQAKDFRRALDTVVARMEDSPLDSLSDGELARLAVSITSEISTLSEAKRRMIEDIKKQFAIVNVDPDGSGAVLTQGDVVGAMEEDIDSLRQDSFRDLEYVQLGMTIGIIDHELQAVIRSLRLNLGRLRSWAVRNEDLAEVYQGIRVNFDHLDSYLRLLTPLQRRSRRTLSEIKGSAIFNFIEELFATRFAEHDISLEQTATFESYSLVSYPSTFYPVFINLVDNAVYWLQRRESGRVVSFEVKGGALLIRDNGPGISGRDRQAVFEAGFTRKPGGMGLGLYIAKSQLRQVNYDIEILDPPNGEGVIFRIAPLKAGNDRSR